MFSSRYWQFGAGFLLFVTVFGVLRVDLEELTTGEVAKASKDDPKNPMVFEEFLGGFGA